MNAPTASSTRTTTGPARPQRPEQPLRCLHGHFMAASATECQIDGCGAPQRRRLSLVKPIPPLAHRHPITPVPLCESAAARAALAAAGARIQVPVLAWHGHPDGSATARLADGTHLHHRTGGPAEFTAVVPCPGGSVHIHTLTGQASLDLARRTTNACEQQHADFTGWAETATRDLSAAFSAYRLNRVRPLHQMHQTQKDGIS